LSYSFEDIDVVLIEIMYLDIILRVGPVSSTVQCMSMLFSIICRAYVYHASFHD